MSHQRSQLATSHGDGLARGHIVAVRVVVQQLHVRERDRDLQALRVRDRETVPAVLHLGHVVHGREVRLAARDLELGDVGPELGERTGRVEVAFGQVMHVIARLAPVRAVPPPRVPGADGASQSHAPHDPEHGFGGYARAELVDQAHAHLPVAAPVRGALPYLPYHRLHVRPGHVRRARQVMVVRGSRQPGYLEEVVEPVSPPCEQSDDGASLASRDFCARRARSFSRYATFAFR